MIYNHRVKRNSVYYEAGSDVPEQAPVKKTGTLPGNPGTEVSDENIEFETNAVKRGRPRKTD